MAVALLFICIHVWLTLSSCESMDNVQQQKGRIEIAATRICKPGPHIEHSEKKPRCLIIGDSVSIGYTYWVTAAAKDVCDVYHAPWDTEDGGALDTKYAVQCLEFFLTTAELEPIKYDVIIFNFGLHDIEYNGQYPEEYTNETLYRHNLETIKGELFRTGSRVGYVLTTPVPFNVTANDGVKRYNTIAREVMAEGEHNLDVADLYQWVVMVCGEPPYNSCSIAAKQPSPHYTSQGYKYLSVMVEGMVRNLLRQGKAGKQSGYQVKDDVIQRQDPTTPCKNSTGATVTVCPATATCAASKYSGSHWGCCPLTHAVSCNDGKHCCPVGYECDSQCDVFQCKCYKANRWILEDEHLDTYW